MAANPSDCSANQFATTIAANGNLTCAVLTDSDVPDTLTIGASSTVADGALSANVTKLGSAIDLATSEVSGQLKATNLQSAGADLGGANVSIDLSNTNGGGFVTNLTVDGTITAATFIGALTGNASTATALAANPSDCSANQFANAIAASGNLSCAGVTDADVSDTLTASNLVGSGSITNAVDLATAEVSGTLRANNLQAAAADLGAADVTVNFSNNNGSFNTNIITDGTVTAATFIGAVTGNASTASALAANPTDCAANQFATAIDASGNLSCAALTDGDIPDSITVNLAATATALAANPSDCSANQFATTIATNGNLTCAAITDADVPNSITVDLATAASALASNPSDCASNQFATTIAANGNLTCASITDADVSDTLTASLFVGTGSTTNAIDLGTAEVAGALSATNLQASAADLGAADVTINLGNTNGSFNTNLTIDGVITAASFVGTLTGNASTATALASNPTDCSANQFATTIAASGNLTCASITDADVSDTLTASNFVGTGSTTSAIDLATGEVAGTLRANNLQTTATDLGAADVTINLGNTNGSFNTNLTLDGSITAGSFIGALTGNASTATALASNPTDCAANQFATAINAAGDLSCAVLTDGDIPNSITVDLATAATALASNPSDCSANQFANAIAASGNLTCVAITDADVSDTLTASNFVGTGSSTNAIDLATAEVSGNLRATNLQAAAADLGAANVTIDLSNTNGGFVTNLTVDGTITAATFVGTLTGNASTATALAADPSDCSANQFANAIAASGNLTCASITDADVSDTLTASSFVGSGSSTNAIDLATAEVAGTLRANNLQAAAADLGAADVTVNFGNTNGAFNTNITTDGTITATTFIGAVTGNASTATALAANPSDCAANQFATAIVASGNLTCASLTDADVPDSITVNLAATATALAANPTDCSANQFANAIAASGNLTCAAITDADVSNTLTASIFVGSGSTTDAIDLATAEVAGTLQSGNVSGSYTGITGTGALDAGSITANFGGIDVGTDTITTTGTIGTAATTTFTGAGATFTGVIAANGGSITSTGVLAITPGGALTVGATGQTALLQGSTTTLTSTGAGNDITLNSADTIELQDNTNVTGDFTVSANTDLAGTLAVGTADALTVAATGTLTTAGDVAVNGGDITSTVALNVGSGTATALTLNSGTTGAINLGSDASAEAINIGTGAGAKTITVGVSGQVTTLDYVTSAATTNAFDLTANAITTADAQGITANALTSGAALSINSSSAGLTGSMVEILLTGNNSANTGKLLQVSNGNNTSNANTLVNFTNGGTGLSFRVNDDGTDTDSTPFSINATGQVGVGTSSQNDAVDVVGSVDATTGYKQNGTAGITLDCAANEFMGNATSSGGIITAGACEPDDTGISDSRLKDNVVSVSSKINSIKNVNVVDYNYKCLDPLYVALDLTCRDRTGVLAQDMLLIYPELVDNGGNGFLRVREMGLLFYGLAATAEMANLLDGDGTIVAGSVVTDTLTVNTSANISGGIDNNGDGVTNVGNLTGVGNNITASANLTVSSGVASTLTIDSGTTGSINIGSDASAETINIGTGLATKTVVLGSTLQASTVDFNSGATTTNVVDIAANLELSGDALNISTNALTSGAGVSVNSSSALLTGNLVEIQATGNAVTNTGKLLQVSNGNNILNAHTLVNFTNGGTGLSFRVNDDGTDTDATPFSINAAGQVGVGTAAQNDALDVVGSIDATVGYKANGVAGLTLAACTAAQYIGNAVKLTGGIITAGSCRTDGVSDERLKENVVNIEDNTLTKLKQIRAVTFDFKCGDAQYVNSGMDCSYGSSHSGVIAQELAQVFPNLVFQDENGYFNVRYQELSMYTLKSVQELAATVDELGLLRGDVENLQTRVTNIENSGFTNSNGDPVHFADLTVDHMTVNMDLFTQGALTVEGQANFNAEVFFAQLASFGNSVIFNKDVTFNDNVSFSNNTGGYARIEAGHDTVHVTFSKPFAQAPIVSLSLDSKFVQYSYANVTADGFDIMLNLPATEQLQFSWIALSVNSPGLSQ